MSNTYPTLTLKPGREANAGFQHPWIFSGALADIPKDLLHGSLVHVADKQGKILGTGTYSATSSIAVRLFSFTQTIIDQTWLETKIRAALTRRQLLGFGPKTDTTGYRLIFAEADQIPGLIVDIYNDVAVIQISTAGTDQLKPLIVEALKTVINPKAIIERSDIDIRKQEQLEHFTATLHGSVNEAVVFKEHGLNFLADVINGQKTGFFLDQKNTRQAIAHYVKNKTVLNIFSHTGANAVVALKNGATSVHNIDLSQEALDVIPNQLATNDLPLTKSTSEQADAFQWLGLKHDEQYDVVIADPPALIKSKNQKEAAMKAYHFMNRSAMRLVKDQGIFITSSCSRYLTEEDLAFTLRRAAVQNNLRLELLQVIRQAEDHPLSIYFPESAYLKTFICQVQK